MTKSELFAHIQKVQSQIEALESKIADDKATIANLELKIGVDEAKLESLKHSIELVSAYAKVTEEEAKAKQSAMQDRLNALAIKVRTGETLTFQDIKLFAETSGLFIEAFIEEDPEEEPDKEEAAA